VEWTLHILSFPAFNKSASGSLAEYTLQTALSRASSWDLRIASRVLEASDIPISKSAREMWRAVLDAAREDAASAAAQEEAEREERGDADADAMDIDPETTANAKANDANDAAANSQIQTELGQAASIDTESNARDNDAAANSQIQTELLQAAAPTTKALKATPSKELPMKQKLRGPQKYVGLWRPQPIGVLPVGWEVDE
jgi:hypothetical protein